MKRNHRTGNTRKRVISFLLSALMVLSIVMPGGSGQVRYNAYAEGEVSADENILDFASPTDAEDEYTDDTYENTVLGTTEQGDIVSDSYAIEDINLDKNSTEYLEEVIIGNENTNEINLDEENSEAEEAEELEEISDRPTFYSASVDGLSVVATPYSPETFPEGVRLVVTPIKYGSAYDAYISALGDKATEDGKLYDVAFIYDTEDGSFEYEPTDSSVQVRFSLSDYKLDEIGAESADEIEIIHLPLADGVKDDGEKTIETDFSASDVIVDEVYVNVPNDNTVTFNISSFSSYYITSNGDESEDVNEASNTRLENFIKDVTLLDDGEEMTSTPWKVRSDEDKTYALELSFSEDEREYGIQFDNTTGEFSYILPAGISYASANSETFEIEFTSSSDSTVYKIESNTYKVDLVDNNYVITGKFDYSGDAGEKLKLANNTEFKLKLDVQFAEGADKLDFGYGVTKTVTVDNSNNVKVEKSGSFDNGDGTATFVVTVTSNGTNNNVVVNDVISGTALAFDGIISAKLSNGTDVSYTSTGTQPSNGFNINLGSMTNGQKAIITYKAKVNLNDVTGQGSVDETSNTAKVTSSQDSTGDTATTNLEKKINYTSFSKSGSASDTVTDGKRTVTWTVVYNAEQLKSMAGNTITDRIDSSSQQYLSFANDMQIKITREYKDGTSSTTDTVSPTSQSSTEWTYKIPDEDKKPIKYTIVYETIADVSTINSGINVSNTVSDNNGFTSGSKGTTVGPTEANVLGISKQVDSVNQYQTNWIITVQVPGTGLSAGAVIEDTLPYTLKSWSDPTEEDKFEDTYVEGSVTAKLDSSDFSDYNITQSDASGLWSGNKVIITLPNGIAGTGSTQYLVVTLTSNNNQDWLEYAAQNGGNYPNHENNVKVTSDGTEKTDKATSVPAIQSVEKTAQEYQAKTWTAPYLPTYKYEIKLYGITSDVLPLTVSDDYDDLLTLGDGTNETGCAAPIIQPYNSYAGIGSATPISSSNINDDGTKTVYTITDDMLAKQDNGEYYSEYTIVYFLRPDSETAYQSMINAAIADPNSEYVATNTVTCPLGTATNELVTYSYIPATKNITNYDSELNVAEGINKNTVFPEYEIVINPNKEKLNDGKSMVATDVIEKQSFEYDTIEITTDPENKKSEVTYNVSGYTLTFNIPDETKVTIKYKTRISVTSNSAQNVNIKNTFTIKGQDATVDKTVAVKAAADGTASDSSIGIFKQKYGESSTPLEGAVFGVYKYSDNTEVTYKRGEKINQPVTITTDDKGVASINTEDHNIFVGTEYYFKEIKAPTGYMLDDTKYRFTIADEKDGQMANYDEFIYSSGDKLRINNGGAKLQFTKVDENDEPLPGATFGLFSDSTATTTVNDSSGNPITAISSSETDTKGVVTFWNLYEGTYYVKEIDAPDGYDLSDTIYTVTVTQGTNSLEMTHNVPEKVSNDKTSSKGKITVTKNVLKNGVLNTSATGTFKVGLSQTANLTEKITTSSNIKTISVTAGIGNVKFTELENGTYYIYELDDDDKPVGTSYGVYTVGGSGTSVVISDTAKDESVTITNDETTGDIKITKSVTFGANNTIPDEKDTKQFSATVTLGDTSNSNSYTLVRKNTSTSSTANETIAFTNGLATVSIKNFEELTIKDLPVGTTITVQEANAASAFTYYTLDADDSITSGSKTISQDEQSIALINNYEQDSADLTVTKTVTGISQLADAAGKFTFDIYNENAPTTPVYTWTVSASEINSGKFTKKFNVLAGEKYIIKETIVDTISGYTYKETKYTSDVVTTPMSINIQTTGVTTTEIDSNGSKTVNFDNIYEGNKGSITAIKKFISVNGVSDTFYLSLYSVNGADETLYSTNAIKSTGSMTGTSNGLEKMVKWEDIPYGTYKVYETDSEGTKITSSTKYTIDHTDGLSVTLDESTKSAGTITNTEKVGTFTVQKIVTGTGKDTNKAFPIVVTLTYPSTDDVGGKYSIEDGTKNPISVSSGSNTATVTFDLKDTETATFINIPYGTTYSVDEGNLTSITFNGYTKGTITYGGTVGDSDTVGTVGASSPAVVVNNTFTPGTLTIHKTVTGARTWDDVKSYISFNVTYEDSGVTKTLATISGTQDGWTPSGDTYIYTLPINDLSKEYTVTEVVDETNDTELKDYTPTTTSGAAQNPTYVSNAVSGIGFNTTNNAKDAYFKNDYTRKVGEFTVTKNITSEYGVSDAGTNYESDKSFKIYVDFTFPEGCASTGNVSVAGGTGESITTSRVELNLKKNEVAIFTNIPYGTKYTVSEDLSSSELNKGWVKDGITFSKTGERIINSDNDNVNVTVNNKYSWPVNGYITITKTVSGDRKWTDIKDYISFEIAKDGEPNTILKTIPGSDTNWHVDSDGRVATYTITDLALGTRYIVTEKITNDTGESNYVFTKKAGATTTLTDNASSVTTSELNSDNKEGTAYFENNYVIKKGGFTVSKVLTGNTTTDTTSFPIKVTFTYPEGMSVTGKYTTTNNTTATDIPSDKVVTENLANGESITFSGLPFGTTYVVTEDLTTYARYSTQSIVYGSSTTLTKGTITSETASENTNVVVTNLYTPEGKIVIHKTIAGEKTWDEVKGNISFAVSDGTNTVTIQGSATTGWTYDDTTKTATYTIPDCELDKTYSVTETVNTPAGTVWSYYDVKTETGNAEGSLTENTARNVTGISISSTSPVGNAYFKNTYTRKTGKLEIQKTFDSDPNLPSDYASVEFDVKVTLKDESGNKLNGTKTYGGFTFTDGEALVKVSVNSPKAISGIPAGYEYKVEEQSPTNPGYQIVTSGISGTISGTSNTVTVKNKYSPQSVSLKITKNFGDDSAIKSTDVKGTDKIVFTITGPNNYSKNIDYFTFKDAGSTTISDLTAGTYTVKETSYIPNSEYSRTTKVKVGADGTEVTTDSANVAIAAGSTGEVIFTNNYTIIEKAELDISKAVTGANAGDKEFKLEIKYTKDATTKYVAVNKSSATGYSLVNVAPAGDAVPTVKAGETLKIKGLPFGTYIVTEDTGNVALSSYVFNLSGSTVTGSATFDANVAKTVNLTNVYTENRSVKISKLDFATGTMISGAKLQLLKGNEIIEPVWTTDGSIKTITGLKSGVTYTLHEVSAPDGYAVIKDVDFVIGADNSVTVIPGSDGEAVYDAASGVIQLKDKKTSVKISKVDVTSQEELPGATIQIIDEDGEVVEEWTSTDKPYEITGLKTGVTYTLRETVAPDGYQLTTDTTFTLNEDGSVNGTKTTTAKSNEGVLLVEDAPLGVLVINKQGFYNELCADDSNATKALEGVKFTLSKPDDSTFGQTKATDADGVVTFSGLAPGTYEVRETSTIGNYVLDEQVYTVKVNADGSNSGLVDASGKTVENNIIINDEYRADIRFVKVKLGNASQKLPGSTYGLYKLDEDNTLTKIAQATTDEDGVLEFEGVFTGVEYTVRELISPEGFYVSENPITISFAVNDDGKAVIDKIDDGNGTIVLSATGEITWLEPEISVSFIKQDLEGHNLAGAKLKVVDSDGNDIISWTSTTDAYLVDGVFKAGETYNLFEVEAPEGYEVAAPVSFTIDEKAGSEGVDTIVVVMKDAPITTTTVTPPEVTPPAPKTGDNTPVRPVAGMMMASLAGIMYLILIGKRQRKRIRK